MTSTPCIPDFTYFDSPEFLSLSLHIVSIISTPIYCLGVYCILFKTPKQMNSVKWYLLIVHCLIILFDYVVAVLTVPYLLLPTAGGIPYGLLRTLGVPTGIQVVIALTNLSFIFLGTLSVYENRFFILCDFKWKDKWRFWRHIWITLHYLSVVMIYLPIYLLIPDQDIAVHVALLSLLCLPDYIYNAPIFIVATNYIFPFTAVLSEFFECICEILFFITKLIQNGRKEKNWVSKKTFKMHKQFILALIIQLTVPFVMLAGPIVYVFGSIFIKYHNQAGVNFSVITCTTHGLVSTVVMIIVHRPYRLAVISMIRRKEEVKVSVLNILVNRSPVLSFD